MPCFKAWLAARGAWQRNWAREEASSKDARLNPTDVNKNSKKALTVSCFCLTKQKGSVELILPTLQSNSTGSVLINDGTLGAGIKELKPGAAAPSVMCTKCGKWVHCRRAKMKRVTSTLEKDFVCELCVDTKKRNCGTRKRNIIF